ncbi:MAG TPA: hypothetical protein VHM19_17150 [Polyangiales bacterium]|nr:hypothetical protein [Polyangiales bacterium]
MLVSLACIHSGAFAQAQDAPSAPPATADASTALTTEQVSELLARHHDEPPVAEIVRAALDASSESPARFASMLHRARLRGLVPSLELAARRGQGIDLRSTGESQLDDVRLTTADTLTLAASLRFELGRLLFANEEVGIAREARAARARRAELVRSVVELYFLRLRLLLERDLRGRSDIDHEVRIAEAEALLDGFTNGAFHRMMVARRAWKTTGVNTSVSKPR